MSRKPEKAPEQDKRKKRTKQTLTRAVTQIRLIEANPGKLEAWDQLIVAYQVLTQRYVTRFTTEADPDRYAEPIVATTLSERWHRVAIQQAAGIAQSWRSNRENAYQAYLEDLADYAEDQASQNPDPKRKEPFWKAWNTPVLRAPCIQANSNVVVLEPSEDSTFEYWLRISTLDQGNPLRVPVKLAPYHKKVLCGHTSTTSTTLHTRRGVWWLTLSFDEDVPHKTEPEAPVVGVDVGIANFITTSTGKAYGSFPGNLAKKHKRDREKRRRKAKLRACLEKKGVPKHQLPSPSSATGQRLGRQVRQEINRAVNEMLVDHADARIVYEELNVASMRFQARAMHAYLYASQLGHIPEQLAWAAARHGMAAHPVKAAYSSQECSRCHDVDRATRPDQKTFRCVVCGYEDHADHNASVNLARRWGDQELAACTYKAQVKAVLRERHAAWKKKQGAFVVCPAVQLSLWDHSEASTDVAERNQSQM